jgi:hypothetical protein
MPITATPIHSANGRTISRVEVVYVDNPNDDHTVYETSCDVCGENLAQVDDLAEAIDALDDEHECPTDLTDDAADAFRELLTKVASSSVLRAACLMGKRDGRYGLARFHDTVEVPGLSPLVVSAYNLGYTEGAANPRYIGDAKAANPGVTESDEES